MPTPTADHGAPAPLSDPSAIRVSRTGKPFSRLQDAVALLPTPVTSQGRNATSGRRPGAVFSSGTTLLDVAFADRWAEYAAAVAIHEQVVGRPPPEPAVGGRLNARFVEWMMMLPDGWVTDLGLSNRQAMRVLGNGVVPPQAAAAFRLLGAGCMS